MIVLVCGGRNYTNKDRIWAALDHIHAKTPIDLVIEGDANGADDIAGNWGDAHGVHVARVAALWDFYKRAAGFKRNYAMSLLKPDLVVAFPGGNGTQNMVNIAKDAGIQVIDLRHEE